MLSQSELIKFDDEEEKYYYVITNNEQYIDFSIFSSEEWEALEDMNKKFRENQRYLEDMSDSAYSWMFNKNNSMYNHNIDFRDKVYYLDRELRNRFGISFTDLEPIEEYKHNLKSKYDELVNNKRKITKDQLRLWFVQNYDTLSSII